jgi:DNA-directed RNA polymerase subunit L
MDAYTVEKTDKSITLGFKGYDPTVLEPLMKTLNDDKNVAIVRYINQHPELTDAMLYVEVHKGKPEDVIRKASKAVSAYFSTVKQ